MYKGLRADVVLLSGCAFEAVRVNDRVISRQSRSDDCASDDEVLLAARGAIGARWWATDNTNTRERPRGSGWRWSTHDLDRPTSTDRNQLPQQLLSDEARI